MNKITFCLIRHSELSREEFQDYWLNTHADLVRSVASKLSIRRYIQNHTIHNPSIDAGAKVRGIDTENNSHQYDGVAEIWFDSEESLLNSANNPVAKELSRLLLEDEAKFINFEQSKFFFTEERVAEEFE